MIIVEHGNYRGRVHRLSRQTGGRGGLDGCLDCFELLDGGWRRGAVLVDLDVDDGDILKGDPLLDVFDHDGMAMLGGESECRRGCDPSFRLCLYWIHVSD